MITLYVLFCFCIYQINEQVITLPISWYNKNRPGITIKFVNINRSSYQQINTFISVTITDFFSAQINKYKIGTQSFQFETSFTAVTYKEDFELSNNCIIKNFICYCGITVTMYYHNQGIDLGYHITNESYSIVHQLYNTKKLLINNSLFII